MFLVDVSVERCAEVVDWRHRCATLRVDEGPVVLGDIYMPHQHSILANRAESCAASRLY
jgi:hypothetical protein